MVSKYGQMARDTRASGTTISATVEVNSLTPKEMSITVCFYLFLRICSYYDNLLGEWRNDKANGYGEFTQANGGLYKGDWVDDVQ